MYFNYANIPIIAEKYNMAWIPHHIRENFWLHTVLMVLPTWKFQEITTSHFVY
jgi:hypothetical protein